MGQRGSENLFLFFVNSGKTGKYYTRSASMHLLRENKEQFQFYRFEIWQGISG